MSRKGETAVRIWSGEPPINATLFRPNLSSRAAAATTSEQQSTIVPMLHHSSSSNDAITPNWSTHFNTAATASECGGAAVTHKSSTPGGPDGSISSSLLWTKEPYHWAAAAAGNGGPFGSPTDPLDLENIRLNNTNRPSSISGEGGTARTTPHRQPKSVSRQTRPHQNRKNSGVCFLAVVVHIILFEYLTYVSLILRPMLYPHPTPVGIALAIVFHFIFILTLISFIQCVITDPGTVPPNWGFYMGDKNKRRRYCAVCNIWKPDRTHHCSACERCILNMDHHCPWINNCVGFYNRKFFLQLLINALTSLTFVAIHGFVVVFQLGVAWGIAAPHGDLQEPQTKGEVDAGIYALDLVAYALVCTMLFIAVALAIPLVPFLKFHLSLLSHNSTTIESIPPTVGENSSRRQNRTSYDVGFRRNFEQVLGRHCIWWWIPFHCAASRPAGDGVRWRQSYLTAVDEDESHQR